MARWNLSGFGGRAEATGWRPHLPCFISIIFLPTFKKERERRRGRRRQWSSEIRDKRLEENLLRRGKAFSRLQSRGHCVCVTMKGLSKKEAPTRPVIDISFFFSFGGFKCQISLSFVRSLILPIKNKFSRGLDGGFLPCQPRRSFQHLCTSLERVC